MDTDYGPATQHQHDPRNDFDPVDEAADKVVELLAEGDPYHKVTAADIFGDLIRNEHAKAVELLERLFQASVGPRHPEAEEALLKDARQVVDDYLEGAGSWLVERMAEDIEQEEREEAMDDVPANAPGWVA